MTTIKIPYDVPFTVLLLRYKSVKNVNYPHAHTTGTCAFDSVIKKIDLSVSSGAVSAVIIFVHVGRVNRRPNK